MIFNSVSLSENIEVEPEMILCLRQHSDFPDSLLSLVAMLTNIVSYRRVAQCKKVWLGPDSFCLECACFSVIADFPHSKTSSRSGDLETLICP